MNILKMGLVGILAASAYAQTFRGSLSGTVTDSSGAALPAATVKLDNPSTGFTRTTTSTGNGDFFFADLPLGIYSLTVAHQGFEAKKVDRIEIAVSKTTNINVQLGVAQQQQVIEVSAAAVNLETTSSDLSAVVNSQTVQDLPINGRDFRQMIKLAPGVTTATSPSVNGLRTVSNNYQIDGADNNDAMFGGFPAQNQGGVASIPGGLVPIDAIDQFSIQSNAGADMGRNAGSNVNMVRGPTSYTARCISSTAMKTWLPRRRRSLQEAGRRRSETTSPDSRWGGRSSRTRPFSF